MLMMPACIKSLPSLFIYGLFNLSCRVADLKANLLADQSENAEKYEGVAALLEAGGEYIELRDDLQVSHYTSQLLYATALYLVLPLYSVCNNRKIALQFLTSFSARVNCRLCRRVT